MSTLRDRSDAPRVEVQLAEPFIPLLNVKSRYKVYYGGRGGAKSRSFARALIVRAVCQRERVLCAREFQASIKDSVYKLLVDEISELRLQTFFVITREGIFCPSTGSEFIFKGLARNLDEIKSTQGITICWVEEAQLVSHDSWQTLIPTIRERGSEIWISFNPISADAPTYKRFVLSPPPNSVVVKVNWRDNPWFEETELEAERLYMLNVDPEAYDHVWEGFPQTLSDAIVFRNRVVIEDFDTNDDPAFSRPYYGVDWGFANDPTVIVKFRIKNESELAQELYIEEEAYGHGIEIDNVPDLFRRVSGAEDWPIKADSSRPETISYIARQGFNIGPAEKWDGSVEDGIAHLKAYKRIVVHPRLVLTPQELRLYSYKVDKLTNDILPIIVDKHNHAIDALRYGHDGLIQQNGSLGLWKRFQKSVQSGAAMGWRF